MVKGKAKKANHNEKPDYDAAPKDQPSKSFERKQKRSEKKLSFYQKVNDAVASVNAAASLKVKKRISKKSAQRQRKQQRNCEAYDLSAITEHLPELAALRTKEQTKIQGLLQKKIQGLRKKIPKKNIVQVESAQLQEVLKHPAFKEDPFGALHQHLLATQPPAPSEKNARTVKKDKSKRQRKKKKASSGPEAMDISRGVADGL